MWLQCRLIDTWNSWNMQCTYWINHILMYVCSMACCARHSVRKVLALVLRVMSRTHSLNAGWVQTLLLLLNLTWRFVHSYSTGSNPMVALTTPWILPHSIALINLWTLLWKLGISLHFCTQLTSTYILIGLVSCKAWVKSDIPLFVVWSSIVVRPIR